MVSAAPRPLRGRYNEIVAIHERLMAAKAGTGSVLLVEGDAGCGKTRLMDEARTIATSLGFRVGGATGLRGGELGPFATLTAVLFDAGKWALGAYLAKGLDPFAAACAGVRRHAAAGRVAAAEHGPDGVIASDVIAALPRALQGEPAEPGE